MRGCVNGLSLLVAAVVSSAGMAQTPTIRLPVAPVAPTPAPAPTAITKLAGNEWYVIDSDAPILVLASPEGIVRTTEDAGPIKLRGLFVDGAGKVETRTYKGKQVVTVEAVTTGRVELLIVPVGSTAAKDVIRVMLDVTGARPPPGPTPDPKPPEPKPPEPVKSFRVLFVYESGDTLTAAQHSVMYGKTVSDYLNAKTTPDGKWAGWRRFDKDDEAANETASIKALWAAVKPQLTGLPCVVIEVNGKAEILPFPDSPAAALALFKKYGGDK